MPKRYCIIGGGIAGTTAAETIRAHDADTEIFLISTEPHPLYSRVMLPAYVAGEIGREKVMMRSLRDYAERAIQFFPSERVVSVDPNGHRAGTASGRSFDYDALLVASGGRVSEWLPGAPVSERVFRLQTLDDAERIRDFFKKHFGSGRPTGGHAVVVGGGLIALEFVEIFRARKFDVTFLTRSARFWDGKWANPADHERLAEVWKKNGVNVVFGESVAKCVSEGNGIVVRTEAGREIAADCMAVGVGIERVVDFLPLNQTKGSPFLIPKDYPYADVVRGIETDEFLKTALPDIWAAGDIATCRDNGVAQGSRNWSSSVLQGRVAGANMAGAHDAFRMPERYSIGHFGAVLKLENDHAFFKSPEGSPLCA